MLSDDQKIGFARQLVANPLFQELLEEHKAKALAKWRGADPSQEVERNEAWYEDRAWNMLERKIKALAGDEPAEQTGDTQI